MEEEKILGILPVDLKRFMGSGFDFYNLYITNKRIVAGKTGSGLVSRYLSSEIAFAAFGLVGLAVKRAMHEDDSKYRDMSLEQVLAADTKNFEVKFEDVKSIEFKEYSKWRGGEDYFSMTIKTADKKREFLVKKSFYDDVKSLLQKIIPNNLVEK